MKNLHRIVAILSQVIFLIASSSATFGRSPKIQPHLLLIEPNAVSRLTRTKDRYDRRVLERFSRIGGLDYHLRLGSIYWTDLGTGRILSRPLWTTSFTIDTLIELDPRSWRCQALAVDYVGDNLYVLDSKAFKVHVFDLKNSSKHATIYEGKMNKPMDIALDPTAGLVFIADGTRILRMNMDGKSVKPIVEHKRYNIKSVNVDQIAKRLYWSEKNYHSIKSARYDGSDMIVVLANGPDARLPFVVDTAKRAGSYVNVVVSKQRSASPYFLGPASLAVHGSQMFVYDDTLHRIIALTIDERNGQADPSSFRVIYDRIIVSAMRYVHTEGINETTIADPCQGNECPDMCLNAGMSHQTESLKHACVPLSDE
ncbi:hypothetical protein TKK_0018984 [Trichogramma kaykai]|uniref:Bee-milk protein n=1 Tax=Trichogramma kaykai TaxID=54128 RepID=A0ABD2VV66_9HYME